MKIYQINLGLKNAVKSGKTLGRSRTPTNDVPDLFYKYYPMYKN